MLNRIDGPYFTQISGLSMHLLPKFCVNHSQDAKIKIRKVRALKIDIPNSNDKLEFPHYTTAANSRTSFNL